MKSIIISIAILLLNVIFSYQIFAQSGDIVDNEQLLLRHLKKTNYEIDSDAHAIIIYESGYATFFEGYLEYTYTRTAKILGDDAVADLSLINIPQGFHTSISRLSAVTYNLEHDQIVKHSIEKSDVLKDEITENFSVSKFTLPEVKKGSVIHYTYKIISPGWLFVPDWKFQNNYPTLCSEYSIRIPEIINYAALERVNVPMKVVRKLKDMADCEGCSYSESFAEKETNQSWVRRNVPAFKKEPYMGSSENFKERVRIHVKSVSYRGYYRNIYNDWEDYSRKNFFDNKDYCGQVFANNAFLKDKTDELTDGKKTDLEKAISIFIFIRDNVSTIKTEYGQTASYNIREVLKKGQGSKEGVNLLLTAMLRRAGLNSEPVLLSSRNNEILNAMFPDPRNIDMLISKVTIDKKDIFLDAGIKEIPFGTLLPVCYNGYCRVVNDKGGAVMLTPDSIKNKTTIIVSLEPAMEKGNFLMKVDEQFGTYTALENRKKWKGDTSEIRVTLAKAINNGNSLNGSLTNLIIKNITDPEQPLKLHYEANLKLSSGNDLEKIYLDPYFFKFFEKNPFAAATRHYTVQKDYLEDINYILRLQLPEGYVIDDYPKSSIAKFNDNEIMLLKNIMDYNENSRSFSLNSRFITRTTSFSPEEYNDLRSFYDNIMEEQHKKLVIKKLN